MARIIKDLKDDLQSLLGSYENLDAKLGCMEGAIVVFTAYADTIASIKLALNSVDDILESSYEGMTKCVDYIKQISNDLT